MNDFRELTLERSALPPDPLAGTIVPGVMMTPDVSEWTYRVLLPSAISPGAGRILMHDDPDPEERGYGELDANEAATPQAIIGFSKFGTIGVGALVELDWNTNLPYACTARHIYDHIRHNLDPWGVPEREAIAAIELVRAAAIMDNQPESSVKLQRLALL